MATDGKKVKIDNDAPMTPYVEEQVAEEFSIEDPLEREALEKMLVGVSTRKYRRALDALPPEVDEFATSKSAVSRRFVAATKRQLADWLGRDLSGLRLASVMLDGLTFGEHLVLIALGIDTDGKKHVLGLHEGATENASACGALLDDIIERGVSTLHSLLFVIDGAKALHKAIVARFDGRALIQRCQVHKARNVKEHLPDEMHSSVAATMRQAYASGDEKSAKRQLENLAHQLDDEYPSAASSVREGLAETLTRSSSTNRRRGSIHREPTPPRSPTSSVAAPPSLRIAGCSSGIRGGSTPICAPLRRSCSTRGASWPAPSWPPRRYACAAPSEAADYGSCRCRTPGTRMSRRKRSPPSLRCSASSKDAAGSTPTAWSAHCAWTTSWSWLLTTPRFPPSPTRSRPAPASVPSTSSRDRRRRSSSTQWRRRPPRMRQGGSSSSIVPTV